MNTQDSVSGHTDKGKRRGEPAQGSLFERGSDWQQAIHAD